MAAGFLNDSLAPSIAAPIIYNNIPGMATNTVIYEEPDLVPILQEGSGSVPVLGPESNWTWSEPLNPVEKHFFSLVNYTSNPSLFEDPICSHWLPINHIYFQLANLFLFLSYLAPNGIYGILYLRITLTIGCFFFALWGWVILCALDTFVWNVLFVVINLLHAGVICFHLRPVRFSPEIDQVYKSLFEPLKVSRRQFKKALRCTKQIKQVKFQEVYAQEKITRVDSLSLVISGRLVVSQNGKALHIVTQHQFLDSPEWFGVSTDEYFQVSATAIEDSRILVWHRDKLKLTIMSDRFLQAVFDHILGRDVVKKLMQSSESHFGRTSQDMHDYDFEKVNETLTGVANGHCAPNQSEEGESKPLLIVKKANEDSSSITAILSRQMHAPCVDVDAENACENHC